MTKTLNCSFCGKSQHEVKKLVQGDPSRGGPLICNECVLHCLEILFTGKADRRYKDLTRQVARLSLEDELTILDDDLFRLGAERDNVLYDLAALEEVSDSTVQ